MLESSSCSDDQVLFEFRSPASDGSNADGLLVFYDECRIIIDDGSSGVLILDIRMSPTSTVIIYHVFIFDHVPLHFIITFASV